VNGKLLSSDGVPTDWPLVSMLLLVFMMFPLLDCSEKTQRATG
jgi:hypothetical protein